METIFKSAVSHIKANEYTKRKTEEYLMDNLTAVSSASNPVKAKRPLMKRAIAAVCATVFVCAASIGAYAFYKTPTSYLSLDINPSVELGVNAFGKVVCAMAYNNDGKTILDGQSVFGRDVKNAVNTLVKSAAQKGFVAKDGSTVIAVTSETDSSTTAAELQDAAEQGADSAVKSEDETATVQKDNVALERRDEARKLGITPGKLNLIKKLQALDPSITVDEYKDSKVTDIMKKFVELKKATLTNQGDDSSSSTLSSENSDTDSQESSSESGIETAANPNATKSDASSKTSSTVNKQSSNNLDTSVRKNGSNKGADRSASRSRKAANSHKK